MASPASPSAALVRPATAADIPHITAIHNHYITNTVTTFRTEPLSEAEVQSAVAASAAAGLPFLVAAAADNDAAHVLGFAYAAGYRTPVRPGYRHTAEMTILLAPAARGARRRDAADARVDRRSARLCQSWPGERSRDGAGGRKAAPGGDGARRGRPRRGLGPARLVHALRVRAGGAPAPGRLEDGPMGRHRHHAAVAG
ncbi:GNAT family N-acetyltransferase [Mycena indigotica]|uniref:GNAT family N-acetyltransferase n=1 Tax=Mycena indigotica TaxID=2126181 RepID=A0A8H6RYR1_9AGAR|nr:GNAT family N-acetyltransferase [Mycena indigotica]KAF7290210.1 GNAT family N-acetyltransferase [Mycena indigotica]